MKKITFMMIALLCAVVTFAAGPKKQIIALPFTPAKASVQLGKQFNANKLVKQATKSGVAKARAPRKAVAAADLEGSYLWEYAQSNETAEDPTTITGTAGSAYVTISAGAEEGAVTISGMFTNDLTGTINDEYGAIVVEGGQIAGTSQYGDYALYGMLYYEGDDETEAGWYYNDIYIDINEDGTLTFEDWLVRVLSGGQYDGYALTPYWMPGSTLTPGSLEVVVAPENLVTDEYSVSARNYNDDADVSAVWHIGFDGNDVYVQGMCSYIPEAWVKGTLEGTTITFATGQYFGNYANAYDMFLNTMMGTDVVFDYDAETGTLTAQNEFFLTDNSQYYFDSYRNAVAKKVVEKAAMPANPAITALTNGQYGYYITFNVPNVDVDGNGILASKLSYIIYTDIEGEIAPLTFTSATHTRLTEDLTEIPFGFTEDYDFYGTQIYLNELYSANWNNLGIQSIYRGGGEENATEIQWFHIKDYAGPSETTATFNFNTMDVPTSSSVTKDGDITETEGKTITEGSVSLTISPSTTTTPNRFWSTADGPQLRVYGGTLTFTVPEGSNITQIVFNHNGKWGANTVDGTEIPNDAEAKAATWTGEAQTVVVTIAANSQINSIDVTVVSGGGEQPVVNDELVTLPAGVEPVEYMLVASGATSQGNINIQETKLVAFDGNDVYVQGLAYYFPDAFIKGTLTEAGQVSFPSGQFVGEDEYGKEYIVGVTVADDYSFVYAPNILFDFDQESGVLSMAEGIYYGESASSNEVSLYNYFESAVYTPGAFVLPDLVELPEGVETEVWTIDGKFSDSQSSDNIVRQTEVAFDGTDIYVKGIPFYFEEAWMKGTINAETGIATFPTGQFVGSDEYGLEFMVGSEDGETLCDIEFTYDADAKLLTQVTPYIYENGGSADEIAPYGYWSDMIIYAGEPVVEEPVTAPDGLETEAYLFTAKMIENEASRRAEASTDVTFDFNSMDVAVSSGSGTSYVADGDITEDLELTEGDVKLTVSPKDESSSTPNRFWGTNNGPQLRVYSGTLTFEVPEGSSITGITFNAGKWNDSNTADSGEFSSSTWTGDAQTVVVTIGGNTQINNIVVSVKSEGTETGVDYTYQMQVGFDGNDVYFKGLSDNTADMWLKGTMSEDGKTVTIPANQYMGTRSVLWFNFAYYFTAVDAEGAMQDIVLNYDAEANKFTTDQTLVLHDGKRSLGVPYQTFYDVVITKMPEFAATPADPSIDSYKLEGTSYPYISLVIPAKDVDGNDIVSSKLFYTVWIEKEGVEQPFVVSADLYRDVEEDMTEIPYTYDDGYDIYAGGSRLYINTGDNIATWKKIGVQSIYYGGGECNKSNIVWIENPIYDETVVGISQVNAENAKVNVVFDLQGRRVAKVGKGLYIVNGKKVVK